MRKVDITAKLSFDENPVLVIKGQEIEVNSDAPTMLKVMNLVSIEEPGPKDIVDAYTMLFSDESRAKLDEMKLSFDDFMVVIQEAIGLVTGEDKKPGEQ